MQELARHSLVVLSGFSYVEKLVNKMTLYSIIDFLICIIGFLTLFCGYDN